MAMSRVAATNKLVSIAIDKIDSGSNAKKNLNALLREQYFLLILIHTISNKHV